MNKRLFGPALLTTTVGTKYTVPAQTVAKIRSMQVSNGSGSAATFTLSIGFDGPTTEIYTQVTVGAGRSITLQGPWSLDTSEIIQASASANNALVLEIDGTETSSPQTAINGVVYGDSLAGTSGITGSEALSSRLAALRPQDTWNRVSVGSLQFDLPSGGAIGPGGNSFTTLVHNVYYTPGARNVVVLWSVFHGETNDTNETSQQIYDRGRAFVQLAQGLGWEVCLITIPGTTEYNDPASTPYRRPERIGVNALLMNGDGGSRPPKAGAQYLANSAGIYGLGQNDLPVSGNPGGTLIQADGIHLTAAGQSAVANPVSTALG